MNEPSTTAACPCIKYVQSNINIYICKNGSKATKNIELFTQATKNMLLSARISSTIKNKARKRKK